MTIDTAERPAINVLFVCIGNSCRSPMAEAFANELGGGTVRAWSAGVFPLGWISQGTYDVMEEKGIFLDGQSSKSLDEVPLEAMDVVVSMGREIEVPLPDDFKGRLVEWSIPDPFGGEIGRFRTTRDIIEIQVRFLLSEINPETDSRTV